MSSIAHKITKNVNNAQQQASKEHVNKSKHILPMFWYTILASCLIVELLIKSAARETSGFENIMEDSYCKDLWSQGFNKESCVTKTKVQILYLHNTITSTLLLLHIIWPTIVFKSIFCQILCCFPKIDTQSCHTLANHHPLNIPPWDVVVGISRPTKGFTCKFHCRVFIPTYTAGPYTYTLGNEQVSLEMMWIVRWCRSSTLLPTRGEAWGHCQTQ